MDVLLTDGFGNVPSIEFRSIDKYDWVALNAPASAIPVEAMAYKSRTGTNSDRKDRQVST